MSVLAHVEQKLRQAFEPIHLKVRNESHMHRTEPGAESHLKVVIVSEQFEGKRLLQRHRAINELLAEELAGELHALALHTYTPTEWQTEQQAVPSTPSCRGKVD